MSQFSSFIAWNDALYFTASDGLIGTELWKSDGTTGGTVLLKDIFPGAGSQTGIGDIVQSVFFSPKAATASGWIWGAGPVLLLPTGSDDLLSAKKWGAGPTAVAHSARFGARARRASATQRT